jgi:hypothetical protein
MREERCPDQIRSSRLLTSLQLLPLARDQELQPQTAGSPLMIRTDKPLSRKLTESSKGFMWMVVSQTCLTTMH